MNFSRVREQCCHHQMELLPIHAMNDDYVVSGALLFPVAIFVPILSPDITILLSAPPPPWEVRGHTWLLGDPTRPPEDPGVASVLSAQRQGSQETFGVK